MKFQVFKKGVLVNDFDLSSAYMFGADGIPFRDLSKISFKDGIIKCKKRTAESAGLVLLWPVDGFGRVLLSMTRLPDRKRPYILNLELARARLMQITLKREDWTLFEEANSFADLAHKAQGLFIGALQSITEPAKASMLADESLKKAMVFSEKLAAKHAEQYLGVKLANKSLSRHYLGCQIAPELSQNEKYRKRFLEMFGFATIPVSWAKIQPQKSQFDFSSIDRCMEMLSGQRLAIAAGPLLCFGESYLPDWLMKGNFEFEKIREVAYEFVSSIVSRYSKSIHAWRVISGINAYNHFKFNFEQVMEMTRTACLATRIADAQSRKIIEIMQPWGEYYVTNRESIPPLVYSDMVIQSGIRFDAFGLQLHFGRDQAGLQVRDMMQISSRLDTFAGLAKPVHITGVAVPGQRENDSRGVQAGGVWHKEWDQSVQSEWISQFYKIALGKPFVNSITYSNFADGNNMVIPSSGLLTKDIEPKKAFVVLAKLQKLILKK